MSFTKNDLENLLEKVNSAGEDPQIFFILRNRKNHHINYEVKRSRATKEVLQNFKEVLIKKLTFFCKKQDLNITDYDPNFLPDRTSIEIIQNDKIPEYNQLIDLMSSPENLDYFDKIDSDFIKSIWAYSVGIPIGNQSIYYFRKYSQGKVITKGGFINLFYSSGLLSKIDDDVLYFDDNIDSVSINSYMIILQKTLFEQIFSFTDKYESLADTFLNYLKQSNLLSDFDKVADICKSDPQKIKKLASILLQDIDVLKIDYNKIKNVARRWNVELKFDDSSKKIIVEQSNVWNFLKLLGDDFLGSPLTQFKYEVQSKKRRSS